MGDSTDVFPCPTRDPGSVPVKGQQRSSANYEDPEFHGAAVGGGSGRPGDYSRTTGRGGAVMHVHGISERVPIGRERTSECHPPADRLPKPVPVLRRRVDLPPRRTPLRPVTDTGSASRLLALEWDEHIQ